MEWQAGPDVCCLLDILADTDSAMAPVLGITPMWMHPHTNKLMETNTNEPEAKQPPSAGCISRLVRILGYLAVWIGMFIVEFNNGSGQWWALGVICGFFTALAIFHDANA